jgi:hypothetical protein
MSASGILYPEQFVPIESPHIEPRLAHQAHEPHPVRLGAQLAFNYDRHSVGSRWYLLAGCDRSDVQQWERSQI